jgi:hypothetical protein
VNVEYCAAEVYGNRTSRMPITTDHQSIRKNLKLLTL